MYEFDNSSGVGAVALGAGFIEGRQQQQRHEELLAAVSRSNQSDRYIEDLEVAKMQAQLLLSQTEYRSERQIEHLNKLIAHYEEIDKRRIESIVDLRNVLVKYDSSTQSMTKQLHLVIESQKELLASNEELLAIKDKMIEKTTNGMSAAEARIGELQEKIKHLENLVAHHSNGYDLMKKLHDNVATKLDRWRNQYNATRAERDEYYERLVKLHHGGTVTNLVAPATIPKQPEHTAHAPMSMAAAEELARQRSAVALQDVQPIDFFAKPGQNNDPGNPGMKP